MINSIKFQSRSQQNINSANMELPLGNKAFTVQKSYVTFNPPFYNPLIFKNFTQQSSITTSNKKQIAIAVEAARAFIGKNLDIVAPDNETNVYLVRGPALLDRSKHCKGRNNPDGNRSYQVFHKDGKYLNNYSEKNKIISEMKQESYERMKYLKEKLGIDTIISLQCPKAKDFEKFIVKHTEFEEDINIERNNARELGINFIHIPIEPQSTAKADDIMRFFNVMKNIRDNDKIAYVHCKAGVDRTGLMSGVYLKELGVPADKVLNNYANRITSISPLCNKMKDTVEQYKSTGTLKTSESVGFLT